MSHCYAPGVRVEIRDAEWRIKCVDRTSDGGELLTCEGLSELVRGREATFLSKIEKSIRVLAPEDTVLVDDTSSSYSASRLYLATLIRQAPPIDEKIYLGQHAALDNGISYSLHKTVRAGHARDSNIPSTAITTEQNIALGWSDIRDLSTGETVSKTYTDTTQATGPIERTIVYQAPFFKPDREQDYATAWAFFAGEGH